MLQDEVHNRLWDIQFKAEVISRYHDRRGAFLDAINRFLTFLVLIGGTAALSTSLTKWLGTTTSAEITQLYVVFAAVVSGVNLVWDFGHRARDHFDNAKTYKRLIADIETQTSPTEKDAERIIMKFHDTGLSTGAMYWWLYRDCFDEVAVAYETKGNPIGPLNVAQRLLMHWYRAESTARPAHPA